MKQKRSPWNSYETFGFRSQARVVVALLAWNRTALTTVLLAPVCNSCLGPEGKESNWPISQRHLQNERTDGKAGLEPPHASSCFHQPSKPIPRYFRNNEMYTTRTQENDSKLKWIQCRWATNEQKRIQLSSSQWNETNLNAKQVNNGTRQIPFIKTHCL